MRGEISLHSPLFRADADYALGTRILAACRVIARLYLLNKLIDIKNSPLQESRQLLGHGLIQGMPLLDPFFKLCYIPRDLSLARAPAEMVGDETSNLLLRHRA